AVVDTVELNKVIAEVETAKALIELPSPYTGVIAELHAAAGDAVDVGAPLVTFELDTPTDGEDADAPPPNLVGYGAKAEHSGRPARRHSRSASLASPAPAPAPATMSRGERKPSS